MESFIEKFSEDFFELRKRIIIIGVCFLITFLISFLFSGKLIRFILDNGPTRDMVLNSFTPWDVIQVYLKCAFFLTIIANLPFIMLELWLYIRPALTKKERKITLMYIPFVVILLIIGVIFSYFIAFKLAFIFTQGVAKELEVQTIYGIGEYFAFLFNIIVPVACLFEIPVVGMFLTRIGLLYPDTMRKYRKIAYMILLIVATAITPPDFISDFILIMPLFGLYEFSIGVSQLTYGKMQKYKGV